jgi:hypothetical protein
LKKQITAADDAYKLNIANYVQQLKEKDELSQHQIAALKSDFTQKLSVAVKAEEEAKTKLEHKLAEEKRIKDAET